jgi:hypothetical protein
MCFRVGKTPSQEAPACRPQAWWSGDPGGISLTSRLEDRGNAPEPTVDGLYAGARSKVVNPMLPVGSRDVLLILKAVNFFGVRIRKGGVHPTGHMMGFVSLRPSPGRTHMRRKSAWGCALSLIGTLGCPHAFGRRGTIDRAIRQDIVERLQNGRCTPEQIDLHCAEGKDLEACLEPCE